MSTEVFWNDAKPPRSEGEHVAAGWLAMVARNVGLTSVTEDNRREWLWRFAFTQEMRGRRFTGAKGYKRDMGQLESVLCRFRTATLEGRVADRSREEFVEEFTREATDAAREQVDAVIENEHWEAIA
jgi:hypothetical protein